MKRINIKDLARFLSLNASTVSRALSDHPDISKATKDRVTSAAKELNYVPNLHAKYFRSKNSGLIALILPEINMFFTSSLMEGINSILQNSPFSLIIFFSNNSLEKEQDIIRHCLSWVVEGVLLIVSDGTLDTTHLKPLKDSNIPLVQIDKVVYSEDFSSVTIDDKKAAFEATNYLLSNGRKNILGIFGNSNLDITSKRMDGFKEAMNLAKTDYTQYDIINIFDIKNVQKKLESKLYNTPYNGILVMSDELLSYTYPIVRRLNLYPNQLNFVTISDGKLPYQFHPNIPYINHSGLSVGKKAIEILLEEMIDPQQKKQNYKIDTILIEP